MANMSLKSKIRKLLPPTTKNMEEKLSVLDDKLGVMESRLTEMEATLDGVHQSIEQQLITYKEIHKIENSSLNELESVSRKVELLVKGQRYSNAEYFHLPSRFAKKDQILVAGWYGAENLGDELMLKTLLGYFTEEMLLRTTVLLWDCESYPRFELDHRVRTIHYPRTTWDLELLADAYDVIVWGGGAIIDENQLTDDPANINTGNIFIRLNELALARDKKVYCLGLSSNRSFVNSEYIERLKLIVERAALFSVRDSYSAETLECLGIPNDTIIECEDIVFANESILRLRKKREGRKTKDCWKAGIVLFITEGRLGQYVRIVEDVCATIEKLKPSYEIVLIPFLNEDGIDTNLYRQIVSGISSSDSVRIAEYTEKGVIEELADCDFCICYKYHAALIANLLGIRSLNVCCDEHPHYYNKMKHLADIFHYQSHLALSKDFEKNVAKTLTGAICDVQEPVFNEAFIKNCIKWVQEVCIKIGKDGFS